ncbi:hypothetical protein CPTAKMNP4_125 [Salmonella phage vB_SenM-AKM_NP4]|nr:hypothetical protein ACQ31_gp191 [Salmonella phage STML-198]YP_009286485.1 hypothetical protein BI049_gp119 [Salmonella phage vB_SnwM_CGG4-1]WDR21790.1 hypothetical protein PJM34_0122 [Salmonella phage vB_SenM_UTK0003]WLI71750.1 hypothetical protein CPTAKMNP4_125 [Salmonella phage vB_SenM-AKM_NP4]AFU64074.1 hypothetical protein [Salmonella phage STML-198]ANA49473.1 hypothetical protein CGG41_118 [Salmonella phage vB_SnwM_CGG4-1]
MKTYQEFINESKWSGFNFSYEIEGDIKDFKKITNSDFQRYQAGVEKGKNGKIIVHSMENNGAEMVVWKAYGNDSPQLKAIKAKMRSQY